MESLEVNKFLAALEHSRADEIRALTNHLEKSFPDLTGEVKWNAPSFAATGVNVITLRLFPDPILQVVLHVGSKKLVDAPDLRFELEGLSYRWAEKTRCVITLPEGFESHQLDKPISIWLKALKEHQLTK